MPDDSINREMIIQQKEIEDPYDIQNIMKAYRNLQAKDSSFPDIQIRPNNVYLRFLPSDEKELELLRRDTTLLLFDYPLNCCINEGEFSENSSSGTPFAQYCVVPEGKDLPPVKFEVIYKVFIPSDNDQSARSTAGDLSGYYEAIVNESARITGNLPPTDTTNHLISKSSQARWTPKGRIRAWDDLLGVYVPLNHVSVHARWFTHIEKCLTDEEGYFQMKSFRQPVNYSIKWENSLFTIRDGLFFQAWYNGPRMKGDWQLDINSGKSKMFATIHRAAYRQFYGDNLGLYRPSLSTGGRTKICYMNGTGTGQFIGDFTPGGIIPDIQVWGNGTRKATNIVFASVSHELGHQLHSQYVGNIRFLKTSKIIRESWAEAVEWAITNDEYHKLGRQYGVPAAIKYDHQFNTHNDWPTVDDRNYSPIFIDLMDDINQHIVIGPDHPNDLISGYNLSFINRNLLMNSETITDLRREVESHKLDGVDDFTIGELFQLY